MNLLTGDLWTLYVADCREAMAAMPERSVHCVVSSPPYWGLRDYGIPPVDWQDGDRCVFGLEKTIAAYIRHTIEIFDGLRRVLRDDGVIWWNVGDTFAQARGGTEPPAQTVAGGVNGKGGVKERRGMAAGYAAVRIETPLAERKSRKAPRRRRSGDKMQRSLFAGEGK